jgi:dTDP-4-dehydrorhamnose 3,5-epimerase
VNIIDCPLEGLKIIELDHHKDDRGFFTEMFHVKRFAEAGLPHIFLQDNRSRSNPGVLRGLHYQYAPPQGKLVGAVSGSIWDVAVDIRPKSDTYGQYYGIELTGENGRLFWMPSGFAHGFCVLGDQPADVVYKVSSVYNGPGEGGIRFDDPDLHIEWPIKQPILSDRDRNQSTFAQYKKSPPQWM